MNCIFIIKSSNKQRESFHFISDPYDNKKWVQDKTPTPSPDKNMLKSNSANSNDSLVGLLAGSAD